MGAQDVLAGISGALSGGLSGYQWGKERQDRKEERTEANRIRDEEGKRKIAKDAAEETEKQRQLAAARDIIASWPDTLADGSPNQLKLAMQVQYASPKSSLPSTIVRDAGQTQRHNTESADTKAREAGATARGKMTLDFSYDKLKTDEDFRRYAHDTPSGNTVLTEGGRRDRWATPSGNTRLQTETTRRGQDIVAGTAARGQDITQRGQDVRSKDSKYRTDHRPATGFVGLYGPVPTVPGPQPVAPPAAGGGDVPPDTTIPPVAAPVARPSGTPLVTPRAAVAPAPAGPKPNPKLQSLSAQAAAMLSAFNGEQDPVKKKALAAQLAVLRQQILAARGK